MKVFWGNTGTTVAGSRVSVGAAIVIAAAATLWVTELSAEPLNQALVSAYLTNPELKAERASLRAVDEELPEARSGFRPSITASGDIASQDVETSPASATDGRTRPGGYGVTLRQPIFRGFRTVNSVREANDAIWAAREDLRSKEQEVLFDAATAYMDVLRDLATVRLRRSNVNVLSEQLRATQDRFDVGEVTKTDVSQAKARRSRAVSDLNVSRANLRTSQANYKRIIGHRPSRLRYPNGLRKFLPRTLSVATSRGQKENPTILAARYNERAARHVVDRIRGEILPEVNLEASYDKRFDFSKALSGEDRETKSIKGTLVIPFYQGGAVSARVRQAKEIVGQRLQQLDLARTRTEANVVSSWGVLTSSRARIAADQAQVRANTTAYNGVLEEEKVGQRTVLDILDAQQELLDSQVELLGSRRDNTVAAYSLLAATGRLTAADLGLPVSLYDPTVHYDNVKRKWIGFGETLEKTHDHDWRGNMNESHQSMK